MRAVTGMFNSNTIDEVIAEESAFVSKFEKEIDELGSINDDTEDSTKNKYNSLMESLQRQRLEVNKLKELKVMMKDDETIVVLDREQADLRIDQDNDNESFFTLEGVKGMEHTKKAGINVNNAGLWKVGPQGTLLVVVGGFWSLVVCKTAWFLFGLSCTFVVLSFFSTHFPTPHTPPPSQIQKETQNHLFEQSIYPKHRENSKRSQRYDIGPTFGTDHRHSKLHVVPKRRYFGSKKSPCPHRFQRVCPSKPHAQCPDL